MFSITSTETRADEQTTRAAVSAAKAIVENTVAAIEIANPPVVVKRSDGVRVMAWLPIATEDI